jgi:F0F1-type ATP synthase membrane subunit a
VLAGLRLSWDRVSGGNWKSAARVFFLFLVLRADLVFVVAAWENRKEHKTEVRELFEFIYEWWENSIRNYNHTSSVAVTNMKLPHT